MQPPACDGETSFASLFREVREVGRGAHGRVILVEQTSNRAKYVLKQIPLELLPSGGHTALPEVEVLCRLAHPNITRLYGAWKSDGTLNILMDYADGGTLGDKIKERSCMTRLFDEDIVIDWFVQIVSALEHMHANSVIHRDLKAHNVFLTSRNIVKASLVFLSAVCPSRSRVPSHSHYCVAISKLPTPLLLDHHARSRNSARTRYSS
jgi:NIMA (never in mitosis gene a)-related kinase 11